MESAALDTVLLAATLTVLALTGFMLFITLGAILPFSFVFVCVCVLSFFGAACVILPRPDRVPLSRDSRQSFKNQQDRKRTYSKSSKTERGLTQNPATPTPDRVGIMSEGGWDATLSIRKMSREKLSGVESHCSHCEGGGRWCSF